MIRGLEDPAQRAVLSRLVTFKTGAAVIDGATSVPAREITIAEVFRRGSIKISRTRAWPQFAAMVPPATRAILEAEAESQYHNEHLTWIDVERAPPSPRSSSRRRLQMQPPAVHFAPSRRSTGSS